MFKPNNLRAALTEAVPALKENPDMLHMSIDNGKLVSTQATSLSFEHQYTLKLAITGFAGDIDAVLLPIQVWLRVQQADMLATQESRQKGFTYVADINDENSVDLTVSLLLTERAVVTQAGDELHVVYPPEPQPPEPVTRPMTLYVHGERVSDWQEPV